MRKAKVVKDFIGLREIFQNQRRSCVVCVTVAVGWISKTSLSTLLGHTQTYQEAQRNFQALGKAEMLNDSGCFWMGSLFAPGRCGAGCAGGTDPRWVCLFEEPLPTLPRLLAQLCLGLQPQTFNITSQCTLGSAPSALPCTWSRQSKASALH